MCLSEIGLTISTANQCYQQAAELSGDLGEYHRSMELYQTVADWSLTSALTKYSVKEYWLRAALCSMAMGVGHSEQNAINNADSLGPRNDKSPPTNLCSKGRYVSIDARG
jgi:hypothetical protein